MSQLTNEDIWGEPLPHIHKHKCRKCGQTDDCGGSNCPNDEKDYLCVSCLMNQFGEYYGYGK